MEREEVGGEDVTEQEKREKVIKGLEWCMNENHDCYREKGCPYENEGEDIGCKYALHRDALELLNEEEKFCVCGFGNAWLYIKVRQYMEPLFMPATVAEAIEQELQAKTGWRYAQISHNFCPKCGRKIYRPKDSLSEGVKT